MKRHPHTYFTLHCILSLLVLLASCSHEENPTNLPPVVHVEEATNITRTSADLSGQIEQNRQNSVNRIQFRYGTGSDMQQYISITPGQEISTHLTGLQPGTLYYYCLEAGNKYSMIQSEVMTFETQPNTPPTISPVSMLNQGPVSITLEYEILNNGGEDILSTGFYYRKQGDANEQKIELNPQGNRLKGRIYGLQMDADYHIQAYAANSIGETRSEAYLFHTEEAVVLTQAGTLSEAISQEEKYLFANLNMVGPLNGTDIRYLRDMMGIDINGDQTPGILENINLNDASIVSGGISYDGNRYTTDNTISQGMFSNCKKLKKLTVPANTEIIEENAFENCSGLTQLHISPAARQISPSEGCTSLTEITVPAGNPCFTYSDGVLYNKDITSVYWFPENKTTQEFQLPASVTTIEAYAFRHCRAATILLSPATTSIGRAAFTASSIQTITIPDKVEIIPEGCFQQCSQLTSVTLGSNVNYISAYCFDQCLSLKHLYIKATEFPPVCVAETFSGAKHLFETCTLHVPANHKGIYSTHKTWGKFKHIVEE